MNLGKGKKDKVFYRGGDIGGGNHLTSKGSKSGIWVL